ncbi:MAG: LysM peptidoglycan-binding domain-containing protein [Eubacterium sp.]|nr:LysM peptidoglycan-binding domain-containing protein [Eubacterium sp.]
MKNEVSSNIKQIGSITKGQKIYIEDYVITFLKYVTEKNEGKSLMFMLFGNVKKEDGEDALYISGAVEGENTVKYGAIEVFSEEEKKAAERKRARYFNDLEAVGWCYVQPGFGDFLNTDLTTYHLENFTKPYQVLYVTDPLDESRSFFRKEENSPKLRPVSGYIVYYDKNKGMHEYLLSVKKESSSEEKPKENITENVDAYLSSVLRRRRRPVKERGRFSLESIELNPKKAANLLGGLSFALLFVTLIIGGGLLKSNSRIEYIEKQINSLGKNYVELKDNVSQAQAVFANRTESADAAAEEEAPEEAPAETAAEIPEEEQAEAPEEETAESEVSYKEYTVKAGDTLIFLSNYFYGSDDRVDDIMSANNMAEGDMLIEGRTIKIPE